MKRIALCALFAILGCTTANQQQPAAKPPSEFKNVRVLSPTLTRDELINVMRGFNRGLGVKCNFCHVVTATEPKEVLDFPSDAKTEKQIARVMIQMTAQLNGTWMPRAAAAEGQHITAEQVATRVSCWTCHRGKTDPELPPPPQPAR